jgi:hypothetical protein
VSRAPLAVPPKGSEERAPRRLPRGLRGLLDLSGRFAACTVEDLSETGLRLRTDASLPVGARVVFIPRGREDTPLPFALLVEIIRTSPGRLAGRFVALRQGERRSLRAFATSSPRT